MWPATAGRPGPGGPGQAVPHLVFQVHGLRGPPARRVHGARGEALLREVLPREVRGQMYILSQVWQQFQS